MSLVLNVQRSWTVRLVSCSSSISLCVGRYILRFLLSIGYSNEFACFWPILKSCVRCFFFFNFNGSSSRFIFSISIWASIHLWSSIFEWEKETQKEEQKSWNINLHILWPHTAASFISSNTCWIFKQFFSHNTWKKLHKPAAFFLLRVCMVIPIESVNAIQIALLNEVHFFCSFYFENPINIGCILKTRISNGVFQLSSNKQPL